MSLTSQGLPVVYELGSTVLRLDVGKIDWEEVAGFAAQSYALIAPKKLAAQVLGTATAKPKSKKKT